MMTIRYIWYSADCGCRENPGQYDTGNGAIATVEQCDAFPNIQRVTVQSYCGRSSDNRRYYRYASDVEGGLLLRPGARTFKTLRNARGE